MSLLPLPVQTTWSTIPQYTSSQMPSTSVHPSAGIPQPQCAANYFPAVAIRTSPTQVLRGQPLGTVYGLQMPGHLPSCRSQLLQDGVIGPGATNFRSSEPAIQDVSHMSAPVLKISPPFCKNTQENTESVLPGIETLLNAIQVVEGEAGAANQVEDATFTKFTALNSSESEDKRYFSRFSTKRCLQTKAIHNCYILREIFWTDISDQSVLIQLSKTETAF